jgi:hypothetical protein
MPERTVGNDEVRSSVKSMLDKLEISRRKLAGLAGVNQATVKRYIDGTTFSKETEEKLKCALARIETRHHRITDEISTYISGAKPMATNGNESEFLVKMASFPQDLTALRVEVFIDDINHHGRIAFINQGTIQFEYVADRAGIERLIDKLQRMLPLIEK